MALERLFGDGGCRVIELPRGRRIRASEFSEYERIVEALELETQARNSQKNFVLLVEGATDERILSTAWAKLRGGEPPFDIVNAFDCYLVVNTLRRGEVFRNVTLHPSATPRDGCI